MAASRDHFARWLLASVLLAACASAPEPPPQPVARHEAEAPKAPAEAASPEPATVGSPSETAAAAPVEDDVPSRDDAVIVVDPGTDEGQPVSLVEAARAERERRARAGRPVAVITDKTLPGYAAKGQLTIAAPKAPKAPAEAAEAATAVADEEHWRSRGLEIRRRWRQAADAVQELEQRAAEWRRRFYAEDDPYVRDGKVKPEWDRTLDRLQQVRAEVETAKQELTAYLEEGRRAGALPGWLREGIDLEPREEEPQPSPPEPIEPPILDEDGPDGV
jgi:hypothetical protein